MGCAHKENQDGFTLVEISIVMIIIGLLVGGTFGGMKLIENMQVNRTVQDVKTIESAALTFRDTYGRLPGDIVNPSTRLPTCTAAPCATGGNGDRQLEGALSLNAVMTATSERFTFWHHLQAADLLSMEYKNTTDMQFGEGQPNNPLGSGYRISNFNSNTGFGTGASYVYRGAILFPTHEPILDPSAASFNLIACEKAASLDRKLDDGLPFEGRLQTFACGDGASSLSSYIPTGTGYVIIDLRGF